MFLLPYAHERQTVQRLPWVSFILIGLNIIIFLFTNVFSGRDDFKTQEKMDEFFEYYYYHPYLETPEEMKQFFTEGDMKMLETLREGAERPDEETFYEEQEELNRLAQEVTALLGEDTFRKYGWTPGDPHFVNLFTSMFIHADVWHLIGNMLFLYLAGCSIEDLWGRPLYLVFFFLSGIAATLMHDLKLPTSMIPAGGASGAIAGLMGAFLFRLYNTRIHFFYFYWFLFTGPRMGTFGAPAFIMLPLWLLEQFLMAGISDESLGIAVWAHIGGFLFGFLFAGGMKALKIEEKFIAPKIEKKVSLAQNPLFLQAMELSEKDSFPEALILLEKVVRQEPNHLDAYQEMRRICEMNKDYQGYVSATGAILDILIRNKDWDFLLDLYKQFQESPLRNVLPAKTLFGLGTFYEEQQDYASTVEHYQQLVLSYPEDPLAMKAYSKLARVHIEKLGENEKGAEMFWKAYHHKLASDQWRSALELDAKRYGISRSGKEAPARTAPAPAPSPKSPVEVSAPKTSLEFPKQTIPVFIPPAAAGSSQPHPSAPASRIRREQAAGKSAEPDLILLPNEIFDGDIGSGWTVVMCLVDKVALKGLIIRNENQTCAVLPWKKIYCLSVGRMQIVDPATAKLERDFLVIDFLVQQPAGVILYRTFSYDLHFDRLFPRVEQSFSEAYRNFIGMVLHNSGAKCVPDHDRCLGPHFAHFPNMTRYENQLKEKAT